MHTPGEETSEIRLSVPPNKDAWLRGLIARAAFRNGIGVEFTGDPSERPPSDVIYTETIKIGRKKVEMMTTKTIVEWAEARGYRTQRGKLRSAFNQSAYYFSRRNNREIHIDQYVDDRSRAVKRTGIRPEDFALMIEQSRGYDGSLYGDPGIGEDTMNLFEHFLHEYLTQQET